MEHQPTLHPETLGLFAKASTELLTDLGADLLAGHLECLAGLTHSDLVLLYEGLADDDSFSLVAAYGLPADVGSRFARLGPDAARGAGAHSQPASLSWDPQTIDPLPADLLALGIRAHWSFPLWSGGAYVGRLIFGSRRWDAFHDDALAIFGATSAQLALALGRRQNTLKQQRGLAPSAANDHLYAEAQAVRGRFIAVLAHQLRNPIAPLRSGLELLSLGRLDAAATQKTLSMMQRQLGNLVRCLDSLLDNARLSIFNMHDRRDPVRLSDVLQAAVQSVQPAVTARHQQLQVSGVDLAMVVEADPETLSQALANILSATVNDTPEHGRIQVRASREDAHWVLRFEDQGLPTPDRQAGHRLDPLPARAWKLDDDLGIGLGLVRSLVELSGGTAEVEQAPGDGGLVYTVRLPVSDRVVAPAASAESLQQAPWRSHRVLVVDDSRDVAEPLGALLEFDGHTVRVAHDGPGAVTAAQEWQPEVILMDIGLPGFSGLEATRRIRSLASAVRPFIIAVTGWDSDVDKAATKAAGCDRHLAKPIEFSAVRSALQAALGQHHG